MPLVASPRIRNRATAIGPIARVGAVSVAALVAALGGPALAEAAPRAFDASRSSGLYGFAHTWGAAVDDYDANGWEDALVVPHYEAPARLYRNVEGSFTQVPHSAFPARKRDRHNCDWGDVNRDARADVYCSVGGGRGYKRKPNELWMQQPDGSFVDQAGIYRVRDLNGRGRDVAFLDANDDGWLDLFVANGFPRYDGHKSKNRLFINEGGERFSNGREFGVNRQVGGDQVETTDYDRDGLTDLLVCGQHRLILYRNVRGRRFRNVSDRAGVGGDCESAIFARVNHGRRADVVRLRKRRLIVLRQRPSGTFKRVYSRGVRNGGHLAAGRVNRDGLDDLYVLQRGPIDADRTDRMLLNRDNGRRFRKLAIPQTRQGKGESVVPIDHDGNGRSDFIVLNGRNKARGPIRLVAFR